MRFWFLLLLASCSIGPNFHKPDVEMPKKWENSHEPISKWWTLFEDPLLVELIEEGCSYDIEIAQMRLCRARAERKKNLAFRWPFLGLNFDAGHLQQSDQSPLVTTSRNFDIFEAGFDAVWELAIFGQQKRGKEAADAALKIAEEQLNMTKLTFAAELARNYFDLRHAQAQKVIVEKILAMQKGLLDNALLIEQEELGSMQKPLVLSQEMDATEVKLIKLEKSIQLLMGQIAFLVNGLPGSLDHKLDSFVAMPTQPAEPDRGLPSDLLCRRPDVRLVEQLLALKTASVGLAMGDFLPKFDLFTNIGYLSTLLPRLLQGESFNGIYNLLAKLPIFKGGQLMAQLEIAQAEEKEALLNYCKATLGAFHEVDSYLLLYKEKKQQLVHLHNTLEKGAMLVHNLQRLEMEELTSKEMVKIQELKELQNESALLESQAALLEQTLALYKSLGGGWEDL